MNLEFENIGTTVQAGVECVTQRARIDSAMSKTFWVAWRLSQDERLKKSLMLRKESGVWFVYRTVPKDDSIELPPIPMPYVLKNKRGLLSYQPAAVALLTRSLIVHGVAADGSDTGIGKTYSSLACVREVGLRPGIVCRKIGIAGWKRVCDHMGVEPIFIVNWEMARTGKFPFIKRERHPYSGKWTYEWQLPSGSCLIFDEAHMGCNAGTQNNAMWTASKGTRALHLSATFADRPVRLATLVELLGICSADKFKAWLIRRGSFINQQDELESLSSVADMKAIHGMLYPRYGARLSYQDPAVKKMFPKAVHQVELITLSKQQTAWQNQVYHDMLEKIAKYRDMGATHADQLVAELRYRQAAELLKVPVLIEYIDQYMLNGLSVCVFVNYRETLGELSKRLGTRSLIFGEQDRFKINRETVIADFQSNKQRVMILMTEAGGQSISLHDTIGGHQRISLIMPTYNPVALKQVMGRTYRAGAKSVPIIKLCYAAGTVEEKVARSVATKLNNLDALNRGDLMEDDIFNILHKGATDEQ